MKIGIKNTVFQAVSLAACAVISLSSAHAEEIGGHASEVATPGFGTTVASVCEQAEENAELNAELFCALIGKQAKITGFRTDSSGAGPALPPPLFYYWCHKTALFICVKREPEPRPL